LEGDYFSFFYKYTSYLGAQKILKKIKKDYTIYKCKSKKYDKNYKKTEKNYLKGLKK